MGLTPVDDAAPVIWAHELGEAENERLRRISCWIYPFGFSNLMGR